jgi:CubicO group peptidase (beta-lactamase class C family)
VLQVLATQYHVCGVAVVVIKKRQLDTTHAATGCEPAQAVTADSVFQAASLSKTVFAYAVLKLVHQGKMALDTPLVKYLPGAYRHRFNAMSAEPSDVVADARLEVVTARMVLNHTSGLPNWAGGPLQFEFNPGDKWGYSGEGFVLLQRAVEAVTGKPLDRYMAEQVFQPLAMNHSSYVWSEQVAQTLVPASKANGSPRNPMKLVAPIAAFSLYTSAADYGRFMVALLNDAQILKQVTALPVAVDPSLSLSWGLGWGIEQTQDDLYIWHWGNNPGYRAFVMASVQTGDGFVMLTSSDNGLKLAQPVTLEILPDEHKVFEFSMLGDGVVNVLCTSFRLCL